MYTTKDAAARLNLTPQSVARLCKQGQIRAERIGRDYLISDDELARFAALDRPHHRPREEKMHTYPSKYTFDHPEIGLVLISQCGAQSDGCAYDTSERSEGTAPDWLKSILRVERAQWSRGEPGSIDAVLASDGWWWRIL